MIRAEHVIPAVLSEIIKKAPLCAEKVEFAWRSAVGAAVVRVTKVRLDDNGVLHVTAVDAHWASEVKRSSKLIIARLARLLGDDIVKKIRAA